MQKFYLDLQFFADGAATGAEAEAVTGDKEGLQAAAAGTGDKEEPTAAAEDKGQTVSPEEKAEAFKKLIQGEYKDEYSKEAQTIVKQRLKESKTLEDRLNKLNPVLDILGKKYNVDAANNVDALVSAIQGDDSLLEDEAEKHGMSVKQYKETVKMQSDLQRYKAAAEENERREAFARTMSKWTEEGKEVEKAYGSFDLNTELRNSKFLEMLKVPGVSVRTAYELIHKDELIAPAMQYTAQKTAEQVANNIKARGARPEENGTSSQGAVKTQTDFSKLSDDEFKEIRQRIMQGDKSLTF